MRRYDMKKYYDSDSQKRRELYNDKYIDFMNEVVTAEGKTVGRS